MFTRSPLKVLLADPDYNQYLLLKHILQAKCRHYCNLFWYGDRAQYNHALRSGIYDLAIIDAGIDDLDTLKLDKNNQNHTPVVLMVEKVTRENAISASKIGVLGIVDKHHMDEPSLACYLACAELFHQGELGDGFVADVVMLGKHKHLQRPYTYIH
jgi:DNA-binding NtrC family response regulator